MIFINFRKDDTGETAGRLADRLSRVYGEEQVFHYPNSNILGDDYLNNIEENLSKCSVMISLIGPQWRITQDADGCPRIDDPDDLVRRELRTVIHAPEKKVVVLYTKGQTPLKDRAFPDELKALATSHAMEDFDIERDFERLVGTLSDAHGMRLKKSQGTAEGSESGATISDAIIDLKPSNILEVGLYLGRDEDIDKLVRLIAEENERLVTLTGPAGVGKTKLGCSVARQLLPHFERCYFADLRAHESTLGVSIEVAELIGLSLNQAGDVNVLVAKALSGCPPLLIVLDNFEQIDKEAHHETVELWRRHAPQITFLLTSRVKLELLEERVHPVQMLPTLTRNEARKASLDEVREHPTVKLFVEVARRQSNCEEFGVTDSNVEAVVEICRKLDGHPQSIELVACRIDTYTPQELLEELHRAGVTDVAGDRLRKTFEWSFDILEPVQQEIFKQACIFQEGFNPKAADRVLKLMAESPSSRASRVVRQLCDHSLLTRTEVSDATRFALYKVTQEFGREKWNNDSEKRASVLRPNPPLDLGRRWAEYYIEYAEKLNDRVMTENYREAIDLLTLERENILGVHRWALDAGQPQIAARAILAFSQTLRIRGPWENHIELLQRTIEHLGDQDSRLRVSLLLELGFTLIIQGQYPEATAQSENLISEAEKLNDPLALAQALRIRGSAISYGDMNGIAQPEEACNLRRRAVELLTDSEHDIEMGENLGLLACGLGDLNADEEAEEKFNQSISLLRRANALVALSDVLNRMGLWLWHGGRLAAAAKSLGESAEIIRGLDDRRKLAGRLTNLALVATDQGAYDKALDLCEQAQPIHLQQGQKAWAGVNLWAFGRALHRMGHFEEAEARLRESLRMFEDDGGEYDYPENRGLCHLSLAIMYLSSNQVENAEKEIEVAMPILKQRYPAGHRRIFITYLYQALIERAAGRDESACASAKQAKLEADRVGLKPDDNVEWMRQRYADLQELL